MWNPNQKMDAEVDIRMWNKYGQFPPEDREEKEKELRRLIKEEEAATKAATKHAINFYYSRLHSAS